MTRDLARQLKNAGFPIGAYRVGHVFYPPRQGGEWSERSRHYGVTITPNDLDAHIQDIRDGYYCPDVADLIDACGERFARLWVSTSTWTAESKDPPHSALGDSAEEAMAKLWLALNKPGTSHAGATACPGRCDMAANQEQGRQ
jgi:hypothetical protein